MNGRHLLLIGLLGSGKTTVGALAAARLNIPFYDADHLIEEQEGTTVSQLFADRGEAGFRVLERKVVRDLLARDRPSLICPGGGWAAAPGNLEEASSSGTVIYLEVRPATAAARLGTGESRPLLAGGVLARLEELAAARLTFYERADATVSTEGQTPEQVAKELVELARSLGG